MYLLYYVYHDIIVLNKTTTTTTTTGGTPPGKFEILVAKWCYFRASEVQNQTAPWN